MSLVRLPLLLTALAAAAPPAVIFHVIVDDLGWADTGYHAPQTGADAGVQTPRMDALAAEGVLLDRVYVYHMCTPSRSSFLSGRLPVHVEVALPNPENPNQGVPRKMTAIARKLKEQGMQTHVVGKWCVHSARAPLHAQAGATHAPPLSSPPFVSAPGRDLGMATYDHTPKGRGFDSSLIYFEHKVDYFTQQIAQSSCMQYNPATVDLWAHSPAEPEGPARALNGTAYAEYLFRDRVLDIIAAHDPAKGALYLQYDPHIAHCPLQVPRDWLARFNYSDDETACSAQTASIFPGSGPADYRCRNQYHAMVALLDEVLGNVTDAIKAKGWWDQTLMVLHSDNGGPIDIAESASNNLPLRGGKYSKFEGGIRANAFASGGYLPAAVRGTTNAGIIHVADFYSTYCGLAGGEHAACAADAPAAAAGLPPPDSLDVWPLLSGAAAASPRTEVPIDITGKSRALIQGRWKLLTGPQSVAGWQGKTYPNASTPAHDPNAQSHACGAGCLFDVEADAGEHVDVAAANPDIVAAMSARLDALAPSFYSNNETGTDAPLCAGKPAGMPCACFFAQPGNVWDGFFGPYQV